MDHPHPHMQQPQSDLTNLYSFLKANIDSLWLNARNQNTGTFNCNWDAPFDGNGKDGLQGAMNAAMSAFALFATLPPPPKQAATIY